MENRTVAGCWVFCRNKTCRTTPLSSIRLTELMREAGLPYDVINIVPGFGETAGRGIGLHNDIDTVSFNDLTEVERMFMRYSVESNLKGVGLEMGGNSPFRCKVERRFDRARCHVSHSRLAGGGGSDLPVYFIEPAVFQGRTLDMNIAREEISSPVLGIMHMSSLEEALTVASDTDCGLHATVFTQDVDRASHMARSLPCGTTSVNGFSKGDVKRHLVATNNSVHSPATTGPKLLNNTCRQQLFGSKPKNTEF